MRVIRVLFVSFTLPLVAGCQSANLQAWDRKDPFTTSYTDASGKNACVDALINAQRTLIKSLPADLSREEIDQELKKIHFFGIQDMNTTKCEVFILGGTKLQQPNRGLDEILGDEFRRRKEAGEIKHFEFSEDYPFVQLYYQ